MTLNGWQRLWVVLTVLRAIAVGLATWIAWPPTYLSADPRAGVAVSEGIGSLLTDEERKAVRDRWMAGLPDGLTEQRFEELKRTGLETEIKAAEDRRLAGQARALHRQRRNQLMVAGLTCIGFGGLTYALGWTVAWVRRGFSKPWTS